MSDLKLVKLLKNGKYGNLYIAMKNDKKVALKILDKSKYDKKYRDCVQEIKWEIEIHKSLKHPNIVELISYTEEEEKSYLIMEYLFRGDLYQNMIKCPDKRFDETKGSKYFKDIVLAVQYCHSQNIIHRDIKLDNVLVSDDDTAKLMDFGCSIRYNPELKITSLYGTPDYISPEMLKNKPYDFKVDIWCLGISIYEMLVGYTPFYENKYKQTVSRILNGSFTYPDHLSNNAKNLISLLIVKNPKDRLTIPNILKHPFLF